MRIEARKRRNFSIVFNFPSLAHCMPLSPIHSLKKLHNHIYFQVESEYLDQLPT